jgi:Tfp pilus assembly protein PilF
VSENISWPLERAIAALRRNDMATAIDHLRDVLTEEPEHAGAHALLAFSLLGSRRRHAARHEANQALACNPELPLAHRASGYVALAEANIGQARLAFQKALELDPSDEQNLLALARCDSAQGNWTAALDNIERALERDAGSGEALEAKGRVHLARGQLPEAEAAARAALALDPESAEALTLLGAVRLRAGDKDAARDLALWALQIDPSDDSALRLMADIKARQSWLLGLWWRYMVWLSKLGNERAVLVLTLTYIVYQAGVFLLGDLGLESAALGLSLLWLMLCIYTWTASSIQRNMVAKELERVRLKPDF